MLVVPAALTGVALLGPRMLTEAEVRAQKSPPPAANIARHRPRPGSQPVRAPLPRPQLPSTNPVIGEWTTDVTRPSQHPHTEHEDSHVLDGGS